VVLYNDILECLVKRFGESQMPYPLVFEVTNQKLSRVSHIRSAISFLSIYPFIHSSIYRSIYRCIELTKLLSSLASHSLVARSVLEFSSPTKGAMFCPDWMMENLMVGDGDTVTLRLRELPKATKVTVPASMCAALPHVNNELE
jgi:hypothetical protein